MGTYSHLLAMKLIDGEVLAPMLIMLGVIAIPIVGILTRHQRKMAEILHGRASAEDVRAELESVKAELSELRSQLRGLNAQNQSAAAREEELSRRLG